MRQALMVVPYVEQDVVSFTSIGSGSSMPFKFSEDYNQKNLTNTVLSRSESFLGVAGLFALIGSAGFISDHAIRNYGAYSQQTGPEKQFIRTVQIGQKMNVHVFSAEEMVALIRSAFGFSIVDMAKILRVQRPTVYEWLSGNKPQEQNFKRLTAVFDLAKQWNSLSPVPLAGRAKQVVIGGQTFVDLLSSEKIDFTLVTQVIEGLAKTSQEVYQEKQRGSLAERLKVKGFKPHGKDPIPYEVAEVRMPLGNAGKE